MSTNAPPPLQVLTDMWENVCYFFFKNDLKRWFIKEEKNLVVKEGKIVKGNFYNFNHQQELFTSFNKYPFKMLFYLHFRTFQTTFFSTRYCIHTETLIHITCLFFKLCFHAVNYIGPMPQFVRAKTWFYGVILCILSRQCNCLVWIQIVQIIFVTVKIIISLPLL